MVAFVQVRFLGKWANPARAALITLAALLILAASVLLYVHIGLVRRANGIRAKGYIPVIPWFDYCASKDGKCIYFFNGPFAYCYSTKLNRVTRTLNSPVHLWRNGPVQMSSDGKYLFHWVPDNARLEKWDLGRKSLVRTWNLSRLLNNYYWDFFWGTDSKYELMLIGREWRTGTEHYECISVNLPQMTITGQFEKEGVFPILLSGAKAIGFAMNAEDENGVPAELYWEMGHPGELLFKEIWIGREYDLVTLQDLGTNFGHENAISGKWPEEAKLSPDGSTVYFVGMQDNEYYGLRAVHPNQFDNGGVTLANAATGDIIAHYDTESGVTNVFPLANRLDIASDNSYFVVMQQDGNAIIFDMTSNKAHIVETRGRYDTVPIISESERCVYFTWGCDRLYEVPLPF